VAFLHFWASSRHPTGEKQVPSPYRTVAESAEYAHVHEKTIRRWMKSGLRYSKPNRSQQGRVLIKQADLQAFLDRR
jgi:hypothetical protein